MSAELLDVRIVITWNFCNNAEKAASVVEMSVTKEQKMSEVTEKLPRAV
jgi:hypothetical protein